jgi:hypothetical protein
MIQDIIALTIVFSAFAYTIFSAFKTISNKKKAGCGNGCDCPAKKDLKGILLKNAKSLKEGKLVDLKYK